MSAHDWSGVMTGDDEAICAKCGLRVRYVVEIVMRAGSMRPSPVRWSRASRTLQWSPANNTLPKCKAPAPPPARGAHDWDDE